MQTAPLTNDALVQAEQSTSTAAVQTSASLDPGLEVILCTKRDFGVMTDSLQQNMTAIDSIAEFPIVDFPVMEPTVILSQSPFYQLVDAGVQTNDLVACQLA